MTPSVCPSKQRICSLALSVRMSREARRWISRSSRDDLAIQRRASRLMRTLNARLQIRCFEGHTDGVIAVALSPNGKLALSGAVCYTSKDSAARLWDVATGKELRR